MDPNRSREMPSCSAIDLAEIRRSSEINSWICSIISGVVTVLCRPERCASQHPLVNMTSSANCFYQLPQLYLLRTSGSIYVINKKSGERGHELLLVSVPMYSSYLQCAVFEIVRCVESRRGRSRLSLMRFHRGCSIYQFSLHSNYLRDACVNWQSLQFRNRWRITSDSNLFRPKNI